MKYSKAYTIDKGISAAYVHVYKETDVLRGLMEIEVKLCCECQWYACQFFQVGSMSTEDHTHGEADGNDNAWGPG